jgi:chromosome segregation ATPase
VTGESEWASKDVWEEHEREVQQQLEQNRAVEGDQAENNNAWTENDQSSGTGDAELDAGNRQAWNQVSQVRTDIRTLNEVTTDLHAQVVAATDKEAKYDQVLEGTRDAMEEVKSQLQGLMTQQLESAQAFMKAEMANQLASQQEMIRQHTTQTSDQMRALSEAKKAGEAKEVEINSLKNKEEEMKERLKQLEQKFEKAQKDKITAQEEAFKEGLKLEMRQHVAMKEKEKIISTFKNNLRVLDEGLAKERSRHRLNLLKKLQLRRQKNARKKTSSPKTTLSANTVKALRPKSPPHGHSANRPEPFCRDKEPSASPKKSLTIENINRGRSMSALPGDKEEMLIRKAGPLKTKCKSMDSLDRSSDDGSSAQLQPLTVSPSRKKRRRKRPPPPPPSKSLPKLSNTV